MTKRIFIPLVLLTLASPGAAADKPATSPQPAKQQTVIFTPTYNKKTDKPRVPSRQHIYCLYSDGSLDIEFSISEGEATLTVECPSGDIQLHYFDSSEPTTIYIGSVTEASLTISTATDHSYSGIISKDNTIQ